MSVSTDWARKCQCQMTGHGNVKEVPILTDWPSVVTAELDREDFFSQIAL